MNARLPVSANNYLGAFGRIANLLPGQNLRWLRQAREAAIERFDLGGFPDEHDEDWKYTSLSSLEDSRFSVMPASCSDYLADEIAGQALPEAHLLVFVNGRLDPALSRPGRHASGIVLGSLGYMLEQHPLELQETLFAGDSSSAFNNLNLAFMADGAYIRLRPGATVKAPIQLLFIASEANLAMQPRNLLLAAAGSSARIIEQHVTIGAANYFTNTVTNIVLGAGADIEHIKLQQEGHGAFHMAAVNVVQGAKSRFTSASFALGARLARVGIHVALQGEEARCTLDGLYFAENHQHLDQHIRIDHLQPRCTSRVLYKGVLAGVAHAVFTGRVLVHPGAQGSDAVQTNHNLLLSENAEIDTRPQLDIRADDVKCSHGATVGQLDEEQVFYLRSRGIGLATARKLLTHAFAMEMVKRLTLPSLQERLDRVLQKKLGTMKVWPC